MTDWSIDKIEAMLAGSGGDVMTVEANALEIIHFLLDERERVRRDAFDEVLAVAEQVRLKLWREYTDNQSVLLNMVMLEVRTKLEAARDNKKGE